MPTVQKRERSSGNGRTLGATLHNVGPNMADFATFIRDSVISVRDEYDVTEMTQKRMNVAYMFSRKRGGGDVLRRVHGSDVTWRDRLSGEDCTATNRCSRRG